MSSQDEVVQAFPHVETIEDDTLRAQTISVWVTALEDSKYERLDEIHWYADVKDQAPDKMLVDHVNDVTELALDIDTRLTHRHDIDIDRDAVCAGAILHDISKLPENSNETLKELVPHPHYVVHLLADAGIGPEIQHIALAHTERTNVPPATQEAHIVHHADLLAAQAIYRAGTGQLPSEEVLVPSKGD